MIIMKKSTNCWVGLVDDLKHTCVLDKLAMLLHFA